MAVVRMRKNDRLPVLTLRLKQTVSGVAAYLDLTGLDPRLHMKPIGGGALKINDISMTPDADQTSATTKGKATYAWAAADTDTAGLFNATVTITTAGKQYTFPTDPVGDPFQVLIQEDLG